MRVVAGGHTFGFKKYLEEYFPVIKIRIEEILSKYQIYYILVDQRYINIFDIIEDHNSLTQ